MADKLFDYGMDKAIAMANFSKNLKNLKRNVNTLSGRASDVEGQVNNAELLSKKKRKTEVGNWLTDVKTVEAEVLNLENEVESEGTISRFIGGGREIELNQRVDELTEQSRHFGELLSVDRKRGQKLLTKRLVGEAFEKNAEIIWEELVNDKVSSIGIYGMGGVGKTTLTKHIHNKLLEETEDINVLWVTVSQVGNIKKLQDEIAHVLGINLSDEHDEDKRAATLHGALSQEKDFVLILDNMWEYIDLEKVGDPLGVEGGRLMITTRSLEVCCKIGCREVIQVKTLSENEGWELFSEILGQETTVLSDPQIQKIAISMVKVCDGLPLGISVLGGCMRGETDFRMWRDALAELKKSTMGQHEMEDKVFKVLKYSFDRLDPNYQRQEKSNVYTELQQCFLYCSLFPEDCEIERGRLMRMFISEELVGERNRIKEQIDKGYSILQKLVNVCLLERSRDFNGNNCVKMHDLVRAMALRITEGKTMVKAGDYSLKKIPSEEKWTKDLEKVSLMYNDMEEIPGGMSPNCPKLSTLLLNRNQNLHLIADSFSSQMDGLRTLDLSYTRIKELPDSLSDLESLKALILERCLNLINVPYLGKLKELKHLDLSFTAIREVPQGMENLINLKCLSMYGANKLEMLPIGFLLYFPYLQRLILPDQVEAPVDEIERLEELEEFNGRVKNVCDFNRYIRSRQSRGFDFSYFVLVGEKPFGYQTGEMEDYNEVILYQYGFKRGEEKDVTMWAHDIQHLSFVECEGLSKCLLDDIKDPKSFQTLIIRKCEGIECIMRNEQLMAPQELSESSSSSQTIQVIGPSSAPPSQVIIFSSLRELIIEGCNEMKKLGIPVSGLPLLEFLSVSYCSEIEEIIEVASEDEQGRGEEEAPILNRYVSLPKLKKLVLICLPRLTSICKATMICCSIEIFQLSGCEALQELPLYMS